MSMILSFDCSGATASVCLQKDGETVYEELLNRGLTHSETLLALVQRGLQEACFTVKDLSAIALTVGPGSFTGLRIGLALAKGLALPHQLPLIGVSTLEAMAYSVEANGCILAAINARRGEVYWAAFQQKNGLIRLTEDAATSAKFAQMFWEERKESVFIVGDGANLCYNNECITEMLDVEHTPYVARGVAKAAALAYKRGLMQQAQQVNPCYLRLSQAERERLEKLERCKNSKV